MKCKENIEGRHVQGAWEMGSLQRSMNESARWIHGTLYHNLKNVATYFLFYIPLLKIILHLLTFSYNDCGHRRMMSPKTISFIQVRFIIFF